MSIRYMAKLAQDLSKGRISKSVYDMKVAGYRARQAYDRLVSTARTSAERGGPLVNISTCPDSLEWFIDDRVKNNKVSEAEKKISNILKVYNVRYVQEVSLRAIQLPSYGYARFDFLLHIDNPYTLIEYDGQLPHSTEYHIRRDNLKTLWCERHGVPLIRWNKAHYWDMEAVIGELLNRYGIKKR